MDTLDEKDYVLSATIVYPDGRRVPVTSGRRLPTTEEFTIPSASPEEALDNLGKGISFSLSWLRDVLGDIWGTPGIGFECISIAESRQSMGSTWSITDNKAYLAQTGTRFGVWEAPKPDAFESFPV